MIGVWSGSLAGLGEERWVSLGMSLAGFSLLAVLCLVGAGCDRRHWRWLGVAAAAAACSISSYAIIYDIHRTSAVFISIVSIAAVVAHASVMVRCPLKPGQRWLLWGTIGAAITTAFFVDLGESLSPWREELLGRLAGAAAIIGGCGTLALLVVARMNQRIPLAAAPVATLPDAILFCPRCQTKQTIALGSAKCTACGLIIEVRVRESEAEESRRSAECGILNKQPTA
jgi:hypothetical protein